LKRYCSSSWNKTMIHLHFLLNFRFFKVFQILYYFLNRLSFNILYFKIMFNHIWLIYAIIIFIFKSRFFNYIILDLLIVFIIRSYLNVLLILNIYNDIFICLIRFLSRVIEICSLFRALVLWFFKWRIANVWRIFWGSQNLTNFIW
jgi:hypothetical protein